MPPAMRENSIKFIRKLYSLYVSSPFDPSANCTVVFFRQPSRDHRAEITEPSQESIFLSQESRVNISDLTSAKSPFSFSQDLIFDFSARSTQKLKIIFQTKFTFLHQVYDFFVGEDFCEKNRSLANDKNHISEMARGQGAAARAAKALKAEAKSLAPPVDQDQVVKKPRGRPPKVKRDTAQSVNELCMENGDGYAEGTHIHLSLSHAVL